MSKAEKIICAVADYYSVPVRSLRGATRRMSVVFARHVCMFLLREFTKMSMEEIARSLGRDNHTTTLHAIRSIKDKMLDGNVASQIEEIRGNLRQP